ncbi:MAG: hypothetical protein FWD73_17595, partial [Polyangiaceae bacterium]|nr:hypothetical protein [Polyangiaceae bacterium]
AQVMGEIGLVTSVVSGALGPPGAVAQLGIDAVVDRVGTKEDKYAYGAGQMVGAVVTGAAGLAGVGAGIAAEGGSGGAASEVALPLAAAGAQTVVTAGSLAVGAHILMSRGAAPVKPASPDTPATEPENPVAVEPSKSAEPEVVPSGPEAPRKAAGVEAKPQVQKTNIGPKIEKQMAKRGWDRDDIDKLIENPHSTKNVRDTRHLPGGGLEDDPATAYIDQQGHYVIRNDRTGDIVQVSNRHDPNWIAPWN